MIYLDSGGLIKFVKAEPETAALRAWPEVLPARTYRSRLGSLDAIHLATAEPFRADLTGFVTYDRELSGAATDIGLPTTAPR